MKWKEVFDNQQYSTPLQAIKDTITHDLPNFSLPLGEQKIQWTTWLNDEGVWARFATLSQIAILKGEKLESVKRTVFEALKNDDVERNEKGEVEVHVQTYFAWTSRV